MASQRWRDRLLEELHRQGLPSSYVSRLVDELTDHAHDLFKESPGMDAEQNVDARLGTPEHLAAVAKAEFGRRTFAGRHPVWTFLVGPIVAMIGTFVGTFLVTALVEAAVFLLVDTAMGGSLSASMRGKQGPTAFMPFLYCFSYSSIMRFVPFALSTWVFVRLGRRSGRRAWSMVACGLIAVIAVFFISKVTPENAQGESMWMVNYRVTWRIGFSQNLQAAVPLAFGGWMLWRSSASRPKMLAG